MWRRLKLIGEDSQADFTVEAAVESLANKLVEAATDKRIAANAPSTPARISDLRAESQAQIRDVAMRYWLSHISVRQAMDSVSKCLRDAALSSPTA